MVGGMRNKFLVAGALTSVTVLLAFGATAYAETNSIPNRLIDYDGFLTNAARVAVLRNERRLTEDQFVEMAKEPDTIVFDARSDDKYRALHLKGARHLSFPDITEAALAKVFPSKATRI